MCFFCSSLRIIINQFIIENVNQVRYILHVLVTIDIGLPTIYFFFCGNALLLQIITSWEAGISICKMYFWWHLIYIQVSSLPSSFTNKVCSRCLFNCGQKHVASKRIIFEVVCTDCKSRRKNYQWTLFRFISSDFVPQYDLTKRTVNNGMVLNYFHTIYTVNCN